MLRGAAGSLLWVGRECRPDVAAACAMSMSWGSQPPMIRHVKQANKVISELQRTAKVYLRVLPIELDQGVWMSISDASLANDDEKSQGGFIIAYVDRDILAGQLAPMSITCWKSHKLRRVVKALWAPRPWRWTTDSPSLSGCEPCLRKYVFQRPV